MQLMTFIAFFLTKLLAVSSIDISCLAKSDKIIITADGFGSDTSMNSLSLAVRATNRGSPWIWQNNCIATDKNNTIECPRKDMNNAQYFNVTSNFLQNNIATTSNAPLWLYDCYKQHGVQKIEQVTNTYSGFYIEWTHLPWDDSFIKNDVVNISGQTLNTSYQIDVKSSSLSFKEVVIGASYKVCVKTTFYAPITFTVKILQKLTSKTCITITTPDHPDDPEESSFKKPLMAVGIGIAVLFILIFVFIMYNKKCKQGGDHDYDMNKDEELVEENGTGIELPESTHDNANLLQVSVNVENGKGD